MKKVVERDLAEVERGLAEVERALGVLERETMEKDGLERVEKTLVRVSVAEERVMEVVEKGSVDMAKGMEAVEREAHQAWAVGPQALTN